MSEEPTPAAPARKARRRREFKFVVQVYQSDQSTGMYRDHDTAEEFRDRASAERWAKANLKDGDMFRVVQAGPLMQLSTTTVRKTTVEPVES